MIGGGFGGSVLALAREKEAGASPTRSRARYADRAGREATPYVCASVDGAHELAPGNGHQRWCTSGATRRR